MKINEDPFPRAEDLPILSPGDLQPSCVASGVLPFFNLDFVAMSCYAPHAIFNQSNPERSAAEAAACIYSPHPAGVAERDKIPP